MKPLRILKQAEMEADWLVAKTYQEYLTKAFRQKEEIQAGYTAIQANPFHFGFYPRTKFRCYGLQKRKAFASAMKFLPRKLCRDRLLFRPTLSAILD